MLILSTLLLLISNAISLRRDIAILFNRIAIISLFYCLLQRYVGFSISSEGIGLHGGLFHLTTITQIFHIFLYLICIFILQLTSFYPMKEFVENSSLSLPSKEEEDDSKIIEYPLILLFIISGAVFLMSSSDFISVFLSIELQSYGLYLVSTIYRNSELSTTGGLIYFLLGGLSSSFILLGSSLIYANSGTTNLDSLYVITSISDLTHGNILDGSSSLAWYKDDYINFSMLIFSIGFLFKISAAPFHFWSPEVYDAILLCSTGVYEGLYCSLKKLSLSLELRQRTKAMGPGQAYCQPALNCLPAELLAGTPSGVQLIPTIVTTLVAIIAKISVLIFLLELVHYTNQYLLNFHWSYGLLVSSLLSLIVGTVLGLTQFRIKRLFAYSTISHLGFILLALSISSVESTQAFIFYLMQYSISNLNAFIIILTIGFSFDKYVNKDNKGENDELSDIKNSPLQLVSQLKGYFYINPILSLTFALTIFSFMGIPPLLGFFAKQMVLSAALDNSYIFLSLVAILTSVIGAVYYLSIIKEIFFFPVQTAATKPQVCREDSVGRLLIAETTKTTPLQIESMRFNSNNIVMSSPQAITISIVSLIILLFIFINKEWLSMGTILVQILFHS